MSEPSPINEILMDASGAAVAAIRDNNWVAGPWGQNGLRLAGGSIDRHALFVTDFYRWPAAFCVETRLPVQLPPERRDDGLRLCSAINAIGGIVSLDPDRVPVLHNRPTLFHPEESAAAVIAETVRAQRGRAYVFTPAFLALAHGQPPSRIAQQLGIAEQLPFASDPQPAAELDLSRITPSEKALTDARQLHAPEAEIMAVARIQTLNESQPHAEHCAGPLIVHVDGFVECFGCSNPLRHIHGGGCSASCRPGRKLGIGHLCNRCNAPLASG